MPWPVRALYQREERGVGGSRGRVIPRFRDEARQEFLFPEIHPPRGRRGARPPAGGGRAGGHEPGARDDRCDAQTLEVSARTCMTSKLESRNHTSA